MIIVLKNNQTESKINEFKEYLEKKYNVGIHVSVGRDSVVLGLIGDEFKTARKHLMANMPGDAAFKNGRPNPVTDLDPALATVTSPYGDHEELLAMPDSEYMNDKQMAFFRLKLVQLKQDMLNNAGETTEHLREDTVVVPDPADRATIEEEHALELRTRDRERKLLKKIEQSIQRIDSGDYGYCDETGEPIGVGRLLARPTATLSLEAQQRRELKQKMFGD